MKLFVAPHDLRNRQVNRVFQLFFREFNVSSSSAMMICDLSVSDSGFPLCSGVSMDYGIPHVNQVLKV
jgi:hypothetical protein